MTNSLLSQEVSAFLDVSLTHTEVLMPGDKTVANIDKLRVKKVNRTHHMLQGEIEAFIPIDNSFDVLCLSYKKSGNEYRLMPYKIGPKKFCNTLKDEQMIYPELLKVSDLPSQDTCPIMPGKYNIHGYQPDVSKIPVPLKNSDYMIECQLRNAAGDILQGIKLYATVIIVPGYG